MLSLLCASSLLGLAAATVTITDPSDLVNPAAWAADNARLANYNVQPLLYQFIPTVGATTFNNKKGINMSHETLSVDANDTSVVVVTNGSNVNIAYTNIVKFGYASNLLQSSFFGRCSSCGSSRHLTDWSKVSMLPSTWPMTLLFTYPMSI